jgi:D-3-phosphoglycerate dehydrogenase
MRKTVVITDYGFPDLVQEKAMLGDIGYEVNAAHCKSETEVIQLAEMADALLVQWAPITALVINKLEKCKVIVRYGIGVDNIDLVAARNKGIPVCNVPAYCIQEVADHTMALAIAIGRQLVKTDSRLRKGIWKITPPNTLYAFRKMIFATMGYGRIAREVLKRAAAFGFYTAAYDPYLDPHEMEKDNVASLSRAQLFEQADIISLHLPLNEDTRHIINENTLGLMKSNALLINTSRGGLVDTIALADALQKGRIAGGGLDVFETEPLPAEHPILQCENAILTSHTAWYSESSIPLLQRMAAEEIIRGLKGQPLENRVA